MFFPSQQRHFRRCGKVGTLKNKLSLMSLLLLSNKIKVFYFAVVGEEHEQGRY